MRTVPSARRPRRCERSLRTSGPARLLRAARTRAAEAGRTASCGDATGWYASTPSPARSLMRWDHLPEVDAARLLTDVDRRHLLPRTKIDHVHGAGLRSDTLL